MAITTAAELATTGTKLFFLMASIGVRKNAETVIAKNISGQITLEDAEVSTDGTTCTAASLADVVNRDLLL